MATKKTTRSAYQATLKIGGRDYNSKGKSVFEALENLTPGNAKGTGVLVIKKGKESKERILYPRQLTRLFAASPMTRQAQLKGISMLFDI